MTAKVATIEKGSARLGMIVAETFRRKTKMTSTTSPMVRSSVNLASAAEARIRSERCELTRIDIHPHGVLLRTADAHRRHAADHRDALRNRLRVLIDDRQRKRRRVEAQHQYRLVGRVHLL